MPRGVSILLSEGLEEWRRPSFYVPLIFTGKLDKLLESDIIVLGS